LADLGWNGVPLLTAMAEISLAYISAGLDTAAVVRHVDGVIGDDGDGAEDCVRVIGIFLDEARRSGRIECLRRPGTRNATEVLDAMARLRDDRRE
jgi:hypothetical protein